MSEQKEPDKQMPRREFLTLGATVGVGTAAAAVCGFGLYNYMNPNVTYGTPKKFQISKEDMPDPGEEMLLPEHKVLLRRRRDGELAAISLICTHLGCTVARTTTGFQCPCHGSQYDSAGEVVGGPAPRTLAWHNISKMPGDQLEIDTDTVLKDGTFFKV